MPALAANIAIYFASIVAASLVTVPPITVSTMIMAKSAPPIAVTAIAAVAAACAALVDYRIVRRVFRVRALDTVRRHRLFAKAEQAAKVAPFLTTATCAAVPGLFEIVRVLMPLTGYPPMRYALAIAVGRVPRIFVIASFGVAVDVPVRWLVAVCAVSTVAAGLVALARHRGWIGRVDPSSDDPGPPAPPPPAT